MKTTSFFAFAWLVSVCLFAAGCNSKPGPITINGKPVKFVQVNPQDDEEVATVTNFRKAETNYQFRLEVLRAYYERVGNVDKFRQADAELKNLREARWFKWEGGPEVVPPNGQSVEIADERYLVEGVVAAREDYRRAIYELYKLYKDKDNLFKANIVSRLNQRYDFVRTYDYFPEAEVPGPELRPTDVNPEAEALYNEAYKLYKDGKILPAVTDYKKERQALELFLKLVRRYPSSMRIAVAAYYIGDIYKEYFGENLRAVRWYERAWQWDPNIQKPARFQAAVVYDLRLQEKEKALALYKQVIEHEQFNQSNVSFAYDRIEKLTGQK